MVQGAGNVGKRDEVLGRCSDVVVALGWDLIDVTRGMVRRVLMDFTTVIRFVSFTDRTW